MSVSTEQPTPEPDQPKLTRPIWTLTEAAQRTGVSRSTLRRRLSAGAFPNARQDAGGAWLVPVEDLLAAGLSLSRPPAVSVVTEQAQPTSNPASERAQTPSTPTSTEVEELRRELAQERARVEAERARADTERAQRLAAEQVAAERERHLGTALQALRMLEGRPPAPPTAGETPSLLRVVDDAPEIRASRQPEAPASGRRRWWRRQ